MRQTTFIVYAAAALVAATAIHSMENSKVDDDMSSKDFAGPTGTRSSGPLVSDEEMESSHESELPEKVTLMRKTRSWTKKCSNMATCCGMCAKKDKKGSSEKKDKETFLSKTYRVLVTENTSYLKNLFVPTYVQSSSSSAKEISKSAKAAKKKCSSPSASCKDSEDKISYRNVTVAFITVGVLFGQFLGVFDLDLVEYLTGPWSLLCILGALAYAGYSFKNYQNEEVPLSYASLGLAALATLCKLELAGYILLSLITGSDPEDADNSLDKLIDGENNAEVQNKTGTPSTTDIEDPSVTVIPESSLPTQSNNGNPESDQKLPSSDIPTDASGKESSSSALMAVAPAAVLIAAASLLL